MGWVALACAALVQGAQAQVNKCVVDGRTVYTDAPCVATAPPAFASTRSTPQATGAVETQLIWNRYPVKGKDYASVAKSLATNGPKGNHGLASWHISYQYTVKPEGKACRFDSVQLTVTGEILMPHWTDEAAAPPELRMRWQGYYAALQQHEEGHVQHGKELAALVREKFLGAPDFACAQAPSIAKAEFDRLYGNLKERDKDYDLRTQHGAAQGARF